ncbi:MAG: hypothetical protein DCC67_03770 [Planctomycetota bacterium]|nr:MAG: hypothetical protein DCC67_03770 [Planctomycetota bacterium]
MRLGISGAIGLTLAAFALSGGAAFGQGARGYATPASAALPGPSYGQTNGLNNPASRYFGGGKHAVYAGPARARAVAAPAATTPRTAKPFSQVYQAPTVSPYLALDVRESDAAISNYFMYVKPQLDQQRLSAAENRRLQLQLRRAGAAGVAGAPSGGVPTTGNSGRFMNVGSYYPTR